MKILLYLRYFSRSVALRGFLNSIRLLRDEYRYEKHFGLSTAGIIKSNSEEYFHYQGAGYRVLIRILKDLIRTTGDIQFIDIGCGKGRVLIVAENCGYSRLTGIELDKDLAAAASENIRRYAMKRPASHIEINVTNALRYDYPASPAVYFMFNPFNGNVLGNVLDKILQTGSPEAWFVYMNPLYREEFAKRNIEQVEEILTGRYTEALIYRFRRAAQMS